GPRPAALAEALRRRPAALLFQPRTHAVTGTSVSAERMAALAEILRGSDALIIEDDGIGDVSSRPPASLGCWLPGRVVHIRSFSKSLGPDLRLAVLSGTRDIVERIQGFRAFGAGWTSRILQAAAAHLLEDPITEAIVGTARRIYGARRQGLVDRLGRHGIALPA